MAAAQSRRMEAVHENKQPQSLVRNPKDPKFLHLRSLQTPQGRLRRGLYLIEGIRHVARAAEEHAPIQSLFVAPSAISNPFGQKLARRLRQSGIPRRAIGARALSWSHARRGATRPGCRRPAAMVVAERGPAGDGSLWLAVESIDSPGNLGTHPNR